MTLTARRSGHGVHIAVADTGIGPKDLERIFEEFQQVGRPASQRQEGTGLGLALTRRLVVLHGGRIWVDSMLGRGSRSHVLLPVEPPSRGADTPNPRTAEQAKGRGYRVE